MPYTLDVSVVTHGGGCADDYGKLTLKCEPLALRKAEAKPFLVIRLDYKTFLPSKAFISNVSKLIPSNDLTLTPTVFFPRSANCTPHTEQNKWAMISLLKRYVVASSQLPDVKWNRSEVVYLKVENVSNRPIGMKGHLTSSTALY